MKIYFDPNEDGAMGGGGGEMDFASSITTAMDSGDAGAGDPGAAKSDDSAAHDSKVVDDKEPDVKKAEDDPEFEMDFEEEQGKGKAKYKLSQLRETAKWLKDNGQMVAGTLKIREEAKKNPSFGKALQTLINKSYNEKGEYQGQYVDGILKQLEGQQEKVEKNIEDNDDDIQQMEKMLDDLEQDSPHAQILKRNISAAKKLRENLTSALDQNKKFQERLDNLDKFKDSLVSEKENAVKSEKVKQLSDVYTKEVGALTDAAKSDGYKFVDDDEKSDFDRAVRDGIAAKADAIKTDEEFVKTIKDVAKSVYDRMSKRREAYVNDYLRKKGGITREVAPKKDEKQGSRSFEEMGNLIGDAAFSSPDS